MNTLETAVFDGEPEVVCSGWIYAFGMYQPKWKIARHLSSDWSQAVVMAKRKSESVISRFGELIARHLETVLLDDVDYVITHVPAEEDHGMYLFLEFGRGATEMLAEAIHSHLEHRPNVSLAGVLVQVKSKARKQHQCTTDTERAENVRDVYAVSNAAAVDGRCVILVDDILTSGATMQECAGVLRLAGARSVMGIALARTERAGKPRFVTSHAPWAA